MGQARCQPSQRALLPAALPAACRARGLPWCSSWRWPGVLRSFQHLLCHILSSSTFLERPASVSGVGVCKGGPWSYRTLCGGGTGCEREQPGPQPQDTGQLWCWNFLSDFHSPPPSKTETLFNCPLWSAIQDIIILIKCFLRGGPGHQHQQRPGKQPARACWGQCHSQAEGLAPGRRRSWIPVTHLPSS